MKTGAVHLVGAGVIVLASGCREIGGNYTVLTEDEDSGTAVPACQNDDDCDQSNNEGCDDGRCAIRCINDGQCPDLTECWVAKFCTEPIGTPCTANGADECGGYACREIDVNAKPVAGYCPGYCSQTSPCPAGFVCATLSCYRSPEQ